jgi:hypothetical protein
LAKSAYDQRAHCPAAKESTMNVPANQEHSWQAAVTAITEARDQIDKDFAWAGEHGTAPHGSAGELRSDQREPPIRAVAPPNEPVATLERTARETNPDPVAQRSNRSIIPKVIIGLVAMGGLGAAAYGWQSVRDQAMSGTATTSSLPQSTPAPLTATNNLPKAAVPPLQSPQLVQSSSQVVATPTASTSPTPSATAQSIELLSHQITKLEETIGQINNRQMRLDRDNVDLAERLKSMQEQMARDNALVVDQLKAAHSQLVDDNAAMVERLKALQSQLERTNAVISDQSKARQEQTGRAAAKPSEPIPRPKPVRQTTANRGSASPQTAVQRLAPRAQQSPIANRPQP